jgi:hypothetical protein
MSYLNPSEQNLSIRNGICRRFRRNRRAEPSLCQRKLMISRHPALVGLAYEDSHFPFTSMAMVSSFLFTEPRFTKTTVLPK